MKSITISVFNTLKSNNVVVSGWYQYNDSPTIYDLITGATDKRHEQRVYNKKFMSPSIHIASTNLSRIHIKIRHRDRSGFEYEHDYINWDRDICIGWLRPGNIGGDTVNWFFNGESDHWHYGGEKGGTVVTAHRTTCGNISPSIGTGSQTFPPQPGRPDPGTNPGTKPDVPAEPLLDVFVENLTKQAKTLVDGSDTVPTIPNQMEKDREGAYIRGKRTSQRNITRFTFPANSSNYYLGNILLVNDNETFFSRSPISLRFTQDQRKPITFVPNQVVMDDYSMLKQVTPTEWNVKKAMDSFLIKYKQWSKQHNYQLPKVVAPKYYTFENEEAINVGGTIKSISFDASLFKSARSITIVEFKQVLFSVSIDDVYQKGSDFLKNINSNELRAKCLYKGGVYPPAIIETVYYGKSAYLCAVCEDKQGAEFNIGEYIKLGQTGGSKSWKLEAIINGGNESIPAKSLNRDNLQLLIDAMTTPLAANDIETAVPIEFEASYLSAPFSNPVRLDIKPYYRRYVEHVNFRVTENNGGASMSATIRWMEPRLDAYNNWRYVFCEKKKAKLDHTIRMSPWALAIEVKIDVLGARDKYDFNFFIPNIPLDLLRVNTSGECEMKCNIGGSTYFDAKNVTISPMPSGCYFSKSNNIYGVTGHCANLNTQHEILREFFRWCDIKALNSSQMSVIGTDRADKSGWSRE